ncbi:hypothetical protein K435DRAFT_891688 [Dendrothele bispora CBS 962.96]|uniref:Cleavage/polyadenylation specificity factor A subunit C-terminal domain-containing protein n=1 Tax=Dendrothele bispora (strain CBS 962.96) TaxID=1314807 RepID=A0A4S8M3H4_DENBC|nr:hypothetical protein K435DRAFT_891688 [Dendrothele bispora CBS 962.96]
MHLTLQPPPTAITQAIVSNFSGVRRQEIIASHGNHLELLRPDPQTGKISTSFQQMSLDDKFYETFGKSDAHCIVPGQFLAVDPKGRIVTISAMEKAKLVYILNRDAAANLTISSPLETHKNAAIIHHIVGLDMLTYYELDLGLNHVLASSDKYDGPSGVLVCCEDHIIYRHMDAPQHRIPIHRLKGAFFFLVQNEDGDLFKVTIEHEEEEVKAMKMKYFDTVLAASSQCILKLPISDYLYQFQKLGDDNEPEFSSTMYPSFGMSDPTDHYPLLLNILPNSDTPQIFTACGRGTLAVEESVNPYDSYIILSFVNGTLVLSIGETIEEVQDTGFLSSALTLAVQQIGADALLQVHPSGIFVVALSSAELVYFESDLEGQLNEYQDRKAMGSTVLALSIGEVPEGRQRTSAVGCEDQTVLTLETLSLQALTAPPSSICIMEMMDFSITKVEPVMFVNIGLQNGVLLRTVLDRHSYSIQRQPAILALSFTPLIFDNFDYAWSFSAELSPEGLIGIAGSTLWCIPQLGTKLKEDSIPLSITPRKFITHPSNHYFYLIEGDHRVIGNDAAAKKLAELRNQGKDIDDKVLELPQEVFGKPSGTWGSAKRIIDPIEAKTVAYIPLDGNEAAFSLAVVPFSARNDDLHLVVGTAADTLVSPRSCSSGFLRTYQFTDASVTDDGAGLELLHKTETDDVPLALMAFQGRLAAGVGKALRIYDIGKEKLLRKVENKGFASAIISLHTQESVSYVVYKAPENRLLVFAADNQPRWVSAVTMVDYNTVAVGDRFDNILVNRLDPKVTDQVDDDPTAPHKTKMIAHFHIGDLVTSFHKVAMVARGREILLYTCLHGTVGILVPFVSKEDVDFISTLEQHMRQENSSLVGRDHLARGYYTPVKTVIDGDLCEAFARLPTSKQSSIATVISELDEYQLLKEPLT